MTKAEVLSLLKEHQNERGMTHWKRMAVSSELKSFGIGLTQLRKLAKQIGRDHKLALQLWKSNVYDAKVIGLLIDDPKLVTKGTGRGASGTAVGWHAFARVCFVRCDVG